MTHCTNIIIKTLFEASHCWPECPLEDVKFLRDSHRHMFHVVAKKEVTHEDRDVEIIMFKRQISVFLMSLCDTSLATPDLGRMSCEEIARRVLEKFNCNYVSVLEDNENGAEVTIKC